MERSYRGKLADRKASGAFKDMPQCERCGRPVRVRSEDYLSDEVLCTSCAADARVAEQEEDDYI